MPDKIRVEFEMEPDELRELLKVASKAPRRITNNQLKRLAKQGAIRAADFLNDDDIIHIPISTAAKKKKGGKVKVALYAYELGNEVWNVLTAAQLTKQGTTPKE